MYQKIFYSKFCMSFFLFSLLSIQFVVAQKRIKMYEEYINKYRNVAMKHMVRYKIPASITLSQGLLESGAGMGMLTLRSNNHFGIKCHNDWKGESVIAADDLPNDCFRKYKKAEDSFEDHSQFLKDKKRYSSLFSLPITDYKGWAKGLQKAGYATDRAYANKLISLIETYELYKYDKGDPNKLPVIIVNRHIPYKTHNLVYVVARNGDSFESIAAEFNFKDKDLYKYNEVSKDFPLNAGDLVYFEKKKKKADEPYYEHEVVVGESMYSISQLYGIRVKELYKMNHKNSEYIPTEGDILRLR